MVNTKKINEIKDKYRGQPCTEELLDTIFKEVGSEYAYSRVDAIFSPFCDFKVSWCRSCSYAEFKVSDYLDGAPCEVIVEFAVVMFSRCRGVDVSYSADFKEFITQKSFREKAQKSYIKRCRNCKRTAQGNSKDLDSIYQSLVDRGLVSTDWKPCLFWSRYSTGMESGHCSTLMNTVVLNSDLDRDDIEDEVIALAMFAELIYIRRGLAEFGIGEVFDVDEAVQEYPDYDRLAYELKIRGMRLIA